MHSIRYLAILLFVALLTIAGSYRSTLATSASDLEEAAPAPALQSEPTETAPAPTPAPEATATPSPVATATLATTAGETPSASSGGLTSVIRFPITLARALVPHLPPREQRVTEIPLAGPVREARAEVSGMAWYGDYLILLPQYPARFASGDDGRLFALPKADIRAFLDGRLAGPLTPREIRFYAPGLAGSIRNFEGYEAIEFVGDRAFLTIESAAGDPMMGYLVSGRIASDLSEFRVDPATLVELPPPGSHSNMTDETLVTVGDRLFTIYEVNGPSYNESPMVRLFDLSSNSHGTKPFPSIEYRITDATETDAQNRFWALNIYWRGDSRHNPIPDAIAAAHGQGATHARYRLVERLVEFRWTGSRVVLTSTPPIQLELTGDAHNWEGLVRLDDRGFLIVSDEIPGTILGFVAKP